MLKIERVLKQTRLCLALTGLRPEEFLNLLPAFAEAFSARGGLASGEEAKKAARL